jgi:flagellar biosynthesis chaperone FliJ
MSNQTSKYAQKLTALLNKHNEVCNEIATLALQHDIHDSHVQYTLDTMRTRASDLKKQLEHKSAKIEVLLPEVSTDEKKSKIAKVGLDDTKGKAPDLKSGISDNKELSGFDPKPNY